MKIIARPRNMYAVRTLLAVGLADLVEGKDEILDLTGAMGWFSGWDLTALRQRGVRGYSCGSTFSVHVR